MSETYQKFSEDFLSQVVILEYDNFLSHLAFGGLPEGLKENPDFITWLHTNPEILYQVVD